MAKKPRSRSLDFAAYLAARLLVGVVQALPPRAAFAAARLLAWGVYHLDKRHRLVAAENLRLAFPERCADPAACDRLVRATYCHFLTMVVEMILLPRKLHNLSWRRYVTFAADDVLARAMLSGRPLFCVTGHFGNWEVNSYIIGLTGLRTHAIARPLDNPYLEAYLRRFRERTGQKILAKKGDFDQLQVVLANGGVVGVLADQDAGPRGQFIEFFGRPASTHKAIALLALEYNALLLVGGAARVGAPLHYRVELEDVIDPAEYADRPDAVKAITQRFSAGLERLVRRYPEQYFWLHRRWKHQPTARKAKAA